MATSILQFADIHFGVEDEAALGKLAATIERLKPDVSVICGDITQNGSVEEFENAALWINTLPGPKLICAGNHDTPMFGLWQRLTRPFARYNKYIAPLSQHVFEDENVVIQSMNSARGWQMGLDWSLGVVDLPELDRKIADFQSRPPDKLRFLNVHHPFVYPPEAPLQKTTRNGPEALRRLADGQCDGVLSGHVHIPFVVEREPGGSDLLSISAGTLSTRRRGNPAAFNHIAIDAEEIAITMIAFEDDEYMGTEIFRKSRASLSKWRNEAVIMRKRAKTVQPE